MTFHYDIVENENGGIALFIYRQDGTPDNPSLAYNAQDKKLIFTRSPGEVQNILLNKDELIQVFNDPEQKSITVIEVDQDDPDDILSYTLPLKRS